MGARLLQELPALFVESVENLQVLDLAVVFGQFEVGQVEVVGQGHPQQVVPDLLLRKQFGGRQDAVDFQVLLAVLPALEFLRELQEVDLLPALQDLGLQLDDYSVGDLHHRHALVRNEEGQQLTDDV